MIVVKLVHVRAVDAVANDHLLCREIDGPDFAVKEIRSLQELSDRIDDGRDVEVTGGYFVQHRREEKKILAVDQRDIDVRILAEYLFQFQGGIESAKTTAQN